MTAEGLALGGIGLGLAALGRPGYLNLGHGDDLGPARTPEDLRARSASGDFSAPRSPP